MVQWLRMQATQFKALPAALVREFFSSIVRFPLWWYTQGLMFVFFKTAKSTRSASVFFGLDVWLKNLFTPMYGDESFSGRLISFLVRMAMVVGKGLGVLAWTLVAWVLFALYLIVLPAAVLGLIYQLSA